MLTKEILKDLLDDKTLSTNRKAVLFVMVVGSHLELYDKLEKAEAALAELQEKRAWYFECAKMYDWWGWSEEVETYKQWEWVEDDPHSLLGRKKPYYNADNEIAESLKQAEFDLRREV